MCAQKHKICIRDGGRSYTGAGLRNAPLGGTEAAVVHLAEALAALGHEVWCCTALCDISHEYGVTWSPWSAISGQSFDVVIGVSNPSNLVGRTGGVPVVWSHNRTTVHRHLKNRQFFHALRYWPHLVLLGPHHGSHFPRALPYRSRSVIAHGTTPLFFRPNPSAEAPPPKAVFTSQPYRGLQFLLDIWSEVRRQVPGAELHVYAPNKARFDRYEAGAPGVIIRGSVSRGELVENLQGARAALIPGHIDETYCLTAAEATGMGLPIVTLGLGALKERVRDGVNGFVAAGRDEFIGRTVELLRTDSTWMQMHKACFDPRFRRTWEDCARDWETLISGLLRPRAFSATYSTPRPA